MKPYEPPLNPIPINSFFLNHINPHEKISMFIHVARDPSPKAWDEAAEIVPEIVPLL
jgi:hypothetical protein